MLAYIYVVWLHSTTADQLSQTWRRHLLSHKHQRKASSSLREAGISTFLTFCFKKLLKWFTGFQNSCAWIFSSSTSCCSCRSKLDRKSGWMFTMDGFAIILIPFLFHTVLCLSNRYAEPGRLLWYNLCADPTICDYCSNVPVSQHKSWSLQCCCKPKLWRSWNKWNHPFITDSV